MADKRSVRLVVVESTSMPGMLSLRRDCPKRGRLSWTAVREALAESGFEPGDLVEVRLIKAVDVVTDEKNGAA